MFDMQRRIGLTLVFFLLVSGFLAGCSPGADKRLRGYAQDFVTALEIDIVEEKHKVLIAPIHMDEPTSFIASEYIVSDTPEEVMEKLRALHLAEEGWLAPNENGWIGAQVSSLSPRHVTPEEMTEDLERFSLPEGDSEIDFFLICPWYMGPKSDEGKSYISLSLYPNYVILSNSGKLKVLIRDTPEWYSTCLTESGPKPEP